MSVTQCQFHLTAELKCGIECGRALCYFHDTFSDEIINDDFPDKLHDFIAACDAQHGSVYLTRLQFKGLDFVSYLNNYHGLIDFSNSTLENCTFEVHTFSGPFVAIATEFLNTKFNIISFLHGSEFSLARFEGTAAPFDTCTFQTDEWSEELVRSKVCFERTMFTGEAMPFPNCSISGKSVSFESMVLKSNSLNLNIHKPTGDVYDPGYLSISSDEINITNLVFNGYFEYRQDPEHKTHAPVLRLERLMFPSMAAVAFIGANMEHASFIFSVLDTANFINCKWSQRPDTPVGNETENRGRKILYDDFKAIGDESYVVHDEIIRLNIQMKHNFENSSDYGGAGDWFYREMESRRRAAEVFVELEPYYSRSYRVLCIIYKKLSRYGESTATPFKHLIISWLLVSYFYMIGGIKLESWTANRMFKFDITEFFPTIIDFGKSLLFSATVFFRLGESLKQIDEWSFVTFLFQSLATITLLPLFLFALRRRFRR